MILPKYTNSTKMKDLQWKQASNTINNVLMSDLFNYIQNTSDSNYYYWNGPLPGKFLVYFLTNHHVDKLKSNAEPFDFLKIDNTTVRPFLWIGEQGATAHTHYDVQHNFYVQLYGRKRW